MARRGVEPAAPMTLHHHDPNCTGRWKYEVVGGALYWRCQGCRPIAHHSDEVADAAILENTIGIVLQELAHEGQQILDSEGRY